MFQYLILNYPINLENYLSARTQMTNGILPHKSCLNIILKEMHRNLLLSFSESTLTYLSKYTSSGEDFATLQSLIINSLMKNEHKLFVNKHEGGNVMAFVLVICIVIPLNFLSVFLVVVVVISILFF